jgi:hypothetical protein
MDLTGTYPNNSRYIRKVWLVVIITVWLIY